jgi:hypothetical protein
MGVYDAVTKQRMKAMVATMTVKAYNKAKLATYAINGVAQVGIDPELRVTLPARGVPGGPEKTHPGPRRAPGKGHLRGPRGHPDGRGGDDFVCQECEDYAGSTSCPQGSVNTKSTEKVAVRNPVEDRNEFRTPKHGNGKLIAN